MDLRLAFTNDKAAKGIIDKFESASQMPRPPFRALGY